MHKPTFTNFPPPSSAKEGYLLHFEIQDNLATLFFHSDVNFSVTLPFHPSFLLETTNVEGCELFLKKQFEIEKTELVRKIDLAEFNHLVNPYKILLKIYFSNQISFTNAKNKIKKMLTKNEEEIYRQFSFQKKEPPLFTGIFEHDIPFDNLFLIQNDFRVGKWYKFENEKITPSENITLPFLRIFAFDIETTKEPLLFPDAKNDQIMMISILGKKGFLITNREFISKDIQEFAYQPKEDIGATFEIFNEKNEKELLIKFYELIFLHQPEIFTTYNGDSFDIPFIIERSIINDLTEFTHIFSRTTEEATKVKNTKNEKNEEDGILKIIHLDAYKWVKRDSYLPMGSQGLKNVTQVKLGYFPDELDPESLLPLAKEDPQLLASYSVSDSVACHAIYEKYVNLFIFSLCTLIPLNALDVLEKGSGSLCEALLIAQAVKKEVLIPEKNKVIKFDFPFVVSNLNYVGGHVECIRSGIYRHDFEYDFKVEIPFLLSLAEEMNLENGFKEEIKKMGQNEKGILGIKSKPLIYHLDVGAMYPNIILTNRLQPVAIKTEEDCLRCDYFSEKEKCQRKLNWVQRIEYFPPSKKEVSFLISQLENEDFFLEEKGKNVNYKYLPNTKKEAIFKKRIKEFSRTNYKKMHITKEKKQSSVTCQREIPFYLETVSSFRDQRIKYKKLSKTDKKNFQVYESLQIAHKVVLNSFYGYVMRKGSRWYSLEMAAVTCYQGAEIIKEAKQFVEKIGLVLELDTDGIWCLVPEKMPVVYKNENYLKKMLNYLVKKKFSNEQYFIGTEGITEGGYNEIKELNNEIKEINEGGINKKEKEGYNEGINNEIKELNSDLINESMENKKYNSIEFEVDGPYNAMILPSSTEENKLLKKKYLIINKKNEICELKGFEIKRRGELNLIKKFQDDLFSKFTEGSSLEECYSILGEVCDYWLAMITTKASFLTEEEVFSFFSESKSMSKEIEDYDNQNVINASVANRLSEFLGKKVLRSGLKCEYVICDHLGPTAQKAVPIQIFHLEEKKRDFFLRKWIGKTGSIKEVIDWEYYWNRVSNVILKIVVLPALQQGVSNPVKSVVPPKWSAKQSNLDSFFVTEIRVGEGINEMNNEGINEGILSKEILNKGEILNEEINKEEEIINEEEIKEIINEEKSFEEKSLNEVVKEKKDFWVKAFNSSLKSNLKDALVLKEEGKKIEIIFLQNNKVKKEEVHFENNFLLELFDFPEEEKEKKIYKMNGKEIEVLEIKERKRKFENEFVSHLAVKNVYEREVPLLCKANTVYKRKGNDFSYFILSTIKYEKKVFYVVSVFNLFLQNEFPNSEMENKELVFVSTKHLDFQIWSNKSLFHLKETHLAFYLDNLSKAVLQNYCSVRIKEKVPSLLGEIKEIIKERRKVHQKVKKKIEEENEVSKKSGINLLGVNDLDFFFFNFLKEKKELLKDKRETYNVFNSASCIKGSYDYCIMVNLKNTLVYSIIEEKEPIFYEFIKSLFSKKDPFYLKKVEEWIKYSSKVIPQNLKSKLIILQQKYVINQIKKLNDLKIEPIFINKNILIINTKKRKRNEEFVSYLKSKLEIEIIREFDKIVILDEHSYIYKSGEKIKAFGDALVPKEIGEKYFKGEEIKNDLIYELIIKEKASYKTINPIIKMLSLRNEETSALESNCNLLLKRSFFEKEEKYYPLSILCKCKNDNTSFTNGKNKVYCNKCYSEFQNETLDLSLVKQTENEIKEWLANEKNCKNCKESKKRVLQSVCKCGGGFVDCKVEDRSFLVRSDFGKKRVMEFGWAEFK